MYIQSNHSDSRKKSSNEELWDAFRRGDDKALSELFLRYHTKLYRYGMKLLSDEEAVKDGIQGLFLKLWKMRNRISKADSVTFYLLKSFRRILFQQQKQQRSRRQRDQEYMEEFSSRSLTVEDKMVITEQKVEQKELLEEAFHMLTDRQREALFLRLQNGLRNKEIAYVMDLSHQRVRCLVYEATKRLKEFFS
ncbi:RNA polymerase sigma-70 factor, ECF subfamily [Fodinibius roseus]|uniref:RNA polymerase sigma-70 factor, ECF subfamily n=1 Tax=Fodinibius roseus TaxID=1194090 RepID=A0A1M5AWJ2_9BACT|nr:sigma-70 family RNA polymerase sigma factor [Fodinibius roseus]SHF34608.1 RNA polymerase sigma-70 factor, ECF subfamily [Fodinibius roseus]